mmetsp:Transcript_26834/g.58526  ORF Transcript_26834/g.58526 Transcript_26834/m.58526 type:complete len:385 (-) Transcript_26834:291-1445(-)
MRLRAYVQLPVLTTIYLVAAIASNIPTPEVPAKPYACPDWLHDYKEFHSANKHSPDARYLYYYCTHECNGVGDRLRGAMFLLRVAHLYKKILLIHWARPTNLTTFLIPNEIDWRPDDVDPEVFKLPPSDFDADHRQTRRKHPFYQTVFNGLHMRGFNNTKLIRTTVNAEFWMTLHDHDMVRVPTAELRIQYGHCLFSYLFRPSELLESATQTTIQQLYGSPDASYVGWHWRTGGEVGEVELHRNTAGVPNNVTRMGLLLSSVSCAKELAAAAQLPITASRPLLLITDLNPLRRFVARGSLRTLTTTNVTAVHVDYFQSTVDDYLNVFVDIMLIAKARCTLLSGSGISWSGMYVRGVSEERPSCFAFMSDCVKWPLNDWLHSIPV